MRHLFRNIEAALIAGLGSAILMAASAATAQEKKAPAPAEATSNQAPGDEDMTTPDDAATATDDTPDSVDANAPDPVLDNTAAGTPAVEEPAS